MVLDTAKVNLEPGSTLFTDEYEAYKGMPPGTFTHEIINKMEGYVKGRVHVNGAKRASRGAEAA
jgi:hypothetical protein